MFKVRTITHDLRQSRREEFILIQEISKSDTHTQRSLSQNIGLSLGTTNLLIQRLARKGLIKITQLDWKRTQYLLTLKGALEKTNKMYRHTLYTIRLFRQIKTTSTPSCAVSMRTVGAIFTSWPMTRFWTC